jgi:glucose-6-phosphate 1-dehydrogenase
MMSPFVLVIFGATGDLAQHKLLPALYSLYKNKQLGEKFYIVGFARREFSDEQYAHMLGDELEVHKEPEWQSFAKNVYYQQGLFDEPAGYEQLIEKLNNFDKEIGACITRVFYLATPPNNYASILHNLTETKLSEGCGQGSEKWTRLAIEKPFGKDLDTARALDKKLSHIFEEKQIFRVDHYLGKETVQNMIAFRFANSIFEPVWNNEYIDHVQITFAEQKGIGTRGNFWEGVGMLRDVAQNHLLQLLATVAMEQPRSFAKEDVRDERTKAIQAIRPIKPDEVKDNVVRGQYEGYLLEKDVSSESRTDTYVAMKLLVDTERFSGVPFYLRAGKALEKDQVDIKVVFKQTCHILFKEYGCPEVGNVLTIRIQPHEGITLRVIAKNPTFADPSEARGMGLGLTTVDMNFSYQQAFGHHGADAYERILTDILKGDQMLFNRSDELESSWQLISNILKGWEQDQSALPKYTKGIWGPKEAFTLIEKDGRKWL